MGLREGEPGQTLWKIRLEPGRQSRCRLRVFLDSALESFVSFDTTVGVEDGTYVAGDFGFQLEAWHIGLGVLLQVKLAPLPGYTAEDSLACRFQPSVVIADHEGNAR